MSGKMKVLVVDDEQNIVNVIKAYLEAEGHNVIEAYNGIEALEAYNKEEPDFVILDLMMPGISGEEVCVSIRSVSDVPIIMLTAKVSERDKISGLDIGADDYVSKPFSPGELMARVRAISRRRTPQKESQTIFDDGYMKIDDRTKQVTIDNQVISITGTEYDLLVLVSAHNGRVFSREELISQVLGYDYEGYDRTIDTHIKNLRKKIVKPYIETVYGMGYRFKGDAAHDEN